MSRPQPASTPDRPEHHLIADDGLGLCGRPANRYDWTYTDQDVPTDNRCKDCDLAMTVSNPDKTTKRDWWRP